jgi:hypothetical protein
MLMTGPTFFCTKYNMNNTAANQLFESLFPAAPAPAPRPNRKQQAINLTKATGRGLLATGRLIGRGLSATAGGLSQAGRYVALKSESLVQKLERAKLNLAELERRKAANNSSVPIEKITNLKVYIRGLQDKLSQLPTNNSSFLEKLRFGNGGGKTIPRRRSLRTSQNIHNAGREYRKTKSRQLLANFQRAVLELQSMESNSSRRRNLLENFKSYGPTNRTFQNMVNRYIEREKSKPKTNNKGRVIGGATVTGNGRGGQQIIFGGGAPGQAPAAVQAPAAAMPFPMAGPAAAPYPIQMGGGAPPPQVSVKVNSRGPNVGMPRGPNVGMPRGPNVGMPRGPNVGMPRGPNVGVAGVSLPPPSTSQVNMVENAGGPMAIRKAVTALKRANGNVNVAMRATGLPRQTFTNVKNLGGVNIAPRIAASVTRHRKRRTTTKKKPTHKVRKPSIRTNRIKKVVHKVPRKNLERFVLLWALRRKR